MPISFNCTQCGKPYTTSDETAGKRARCKQCGNTMTIPRPKAVDPYGFGEPLPAPPLPREFDDEVLPPRATYRTEKKTSSSGGSTKAIGGALSVLGFIAIIALRIIFRMAVHMGRGHGAPEPPPPPAVVVNENAPIALPAFPDPGPGRPIEPGVNFHEIRLPGGPQPGFSGKLWLYLPSNAQPDHSLPCVLITGAGSNLLVGMDLGDGDRPEHLPYARAGFAVLAFELDGAVPNIQAADDAQIMAAARKFLAARAGLVNAHIAIEYVLAKVPEVDPGRIFVAGHSSAGTLALLFAERESRLKGCAAFAPAIDVAQRLHGAIPLLRQNGLADLVERYSPKTGEANLACPLFLFHAQDDSNVPVSSSTNWAQRLQHLGKTVMLETVPTGNHYDSMIHEGIPRAVAWMQAQPGGGGGVGAPVAGPISPPAAEPVPGPTPPANANGFPAPPAANGFPPPPTGPTPPQPPGFGRLRRRPGMRPHP